MRPQRGRTAAGAVAVAAGVLLLAVEPAAAQSVNRNLIDRLNRQLVYVALPLTLFVEIILVYAVFRFRDNDEPRPTGTDPVLEITWTVATGVVLLFVGFSAFTVLGSPFVSADAGETIDPASDEVGEPTDGFPDDAAVVDVVAYRWSWEFRYPDGNLSTRNELVVPTGTDVYLRITSRDVLHSLFVRGWGVKQDAFPETTRVARTRVTRPDRALIFCTELCGVGHSRMDANATAVAPDRYRAWLDAHRGERGVREVPAPGNGTNATVARVGAP